MKFRPKSTRLIKPNFHVALFLRSSTTASLETRNLSSALVYFVAFPYDFLGQFMEKHVHSVLNKQDTRIESPDLSNRVKTTHWHLDQRNRIQRFLYFSQSQTRWLFEKIIRAQLLIYIRSKCLSWAKILVITLQLRHIYPSRQLRVLCWSLSWHLWETSLSFLQFASILTKIWGHRSIIS